MAYVSGIPTADIHTQPGEYVFIISAAAEGGAVFSPLDDGTLRRIDGPFAGARFTMTDAIEWVRREAVVDGMAKMAEAGEAA